MQSQEILAGVFGEVISGPGAPGEGQRPEASLFEAFFEQARRVLHDALRRPQGAEPARSLLARLGFDLARLETLPMGLFDDQPAMMERLTRAGFSVEQINASKLLADRRLPGRLIGPIRDIEDRIVNFWARDAAGQSPKYLYLNGDWRRDVALFGLDAAKRLLAEGRRELLIVGGVLNALRMRLCGVGNVVAIRGDGRELGRELVRQRWEELAAMGVDRVTLALGQAADPSPGILAAIDHAARAAAAPTLFVLQADDMADPRWPLSATDGPITRKELAHADIDVHAGAVADVVADVVADAEALERFITQRQIHGFRYAALALLKRHKPGAQWTESTRYAALKEADDFYSAAHPNSHGQLNAFFVPPIVEAIRITRATWLNDPEFSQQRWLDLELPPEGPPSPRPAEYRTPYTPARANSDYCELHHCRQTDCFCFD